MKIKFHELFKTLGILAIIGLLSACAGYQSRYAKQLPVQPGDEIKINITADIPLNQARVYSQRGQLISKSDIDKFDVFCSVLMHRINYADNDRLNIVPGKFRVTQVRLSNDYNFQSRVFASNSGDWFYDPPSRVNYDTEIRLQSDEQPEVRALFCVRQIDGYGNHYPRLSDFEAGWGDLVEF
ncbi:MAG: hypothetical protein ACI9KN_001510 [Gammaproteobacteria bacterium]|jgi:hypothetical protein